MLTSPKAGPRGILQNKGKPLLGSPTNHLPTPRRESGVFKCTPRSFPTGQKPWGDGGGQEPVAQGLRAAGSFSLHTQPIRGNGETKSSKCKSRKLRMISKPSSRTLGATVRLPLPARSLSLRGGRVACGAFRLPFVITALSLTLAGAWLESFPACCREPVLSRCRS